MRVGVFWRRFRNVELQKKLTPDKVYDDAYEEAYHHYEALKEAGFDAVLIEWKNDPIKTYETIRKEKIDIIFNASSLKEIEFLELFDIPYVGSGIDLAATDKRMRKDIVAAHGLPTPKYVVAYNSKEIPSVDHLKFPLFVKPIMGRGSAGIDEENIVYDKANLPKVVSKITDKIGQPALIEEFIEGREVTVGIIGYKNPVVLPLLEIGYNNVKTNTYEHKMFDNEIIKCPMEVPKEVEDRIKDIALKIFRVLNARDYARIDMILSKDNVPYFLELNTYAGLTTASEKGERYVHHGYMGYMAKAAGMNRREFIGKILESALERYDFENRKLLLA
ncbi:D-alanine--D-alanine ligase family protein [Caldanaerobacter sp.]|uniref:D-alanine--D-alanine ligase family protein n=1 Tax=Caldanaerobacter sp. TaxID=2930036 RepID=UPI003C73263E